MISIKPFLQPYWQVRMVHILFALLLFFFSPLLISDTFSLQAAVVINEVFPITEDITKQWIELYNNGPDSVSLDRWKLENTYGEKKEFVMNASSIIPARGFLTFSQTQTGITLYKDGDTIKLFDTSNTMVDSQNYQSILGYNNAVGRSIDGEGSWINCTTATYNLPNNCPPPPTPLPTAIPSPTPIPPTLTPFPTLTPTPVLAAIISVFPEEKITSETQPQILGESRESQPESSSSIKSRIPLEKTQLLGIVMILVSVVWIVLLRLGYMHVKHKHTNP